MNDMMALLGAKFVQDALKAALMVGIACSFLGVFVVLKRIVFVGAALAEVSSLGAALAFFPPVAGGWHVLVESVPVLHPLEHYTPLVFAILFMLMAVAFFSHPRLGRRIPREAIIGATFAGAIGLTLLVLAPNPSGKEHAMQALSGNIVGVPELEIVEMAVTCIAIALLHGLFFKAFVLVSFDPEVARTLGFNAAKWDLLWYLILGVTIAVSIHVAGTVLVFAYLVIPPVSALQLSRRLGVVLALSMAISVVATLAGVLISVSPADLPASPTIVGGMVALWALAWLGGNLARLRAPKPV